MKSGGSGVPLPPVDSFLRATNQEVAGSSPAGPANRMKELRPGGDHRAFFVCNEIATKRSAATEERPWGGALRVSGVRAAWNELGGRAGEGSAFTHAGTGSPLVGS